MGGNGNRSFRLCKKVVPVENMQGEAKVSCANEHLTDSKRAANLRFRATFRESRSSGEIRAEHAEPMKSRGAERGLSSGAWVRTIFS